MSGFQGRGRPRHWHPPGNGDLRGANRAPWIFGFQPHFNQSYTPRPPNAWHGHRWEKRVPWRFPTPSSANNVFPPRSHPPFGVSGQVAWDFNTPSSRTPFHFGTESDPNVHETTIVSKDSDCHKSKNCDIVTPKLSESAQQKCETKILKGKEEISSNRNQRSDRRDKTSPFGGSDTRWREGESRHRSRSDERKKDVKSSRTADSGKKCEESELRRSSYKSDCVGKSEQRQKSSSSRSGSSRETSVSSSNRSSSVSSSVSSKKSFPPSSPLNDSRKHETLKQPVKQVKPVVSKQSKPPVAKQSKPTTTKQSKPSTATTSKASNSEDARKNHISKAADRLKRYLQECSGKKEEVLENLLSKSEDPKPSLKSPGTSQDKHCFNPDLQLTAKDLQDIGKIKSSAPSALQKLSSENAITSDFSEHFDDIEILEHSSSTEWIVLDDVETVEENCLPEEPSESTSSAKISNGKEKLPNGNKNEISQKPGEDNLASKEVLLAPKKSSAYSIKSSEIKSSDIKSTEIVKPCATTTSSQSTSCGPSSSKQQNATISQPSGNSDACSSRTRSSFKEKTPSRIEKSIEKSPSTRSIFLPNVTPSRSRHTSDSVAPNTPEKHSIETAQEDVSLNPAKRAKRSRSASINADEQEGISRRKSFSGGAGASCGPGKSLDDFKQQLLKMNLKDVVTNPNFNRKAEMVMQQLMKEHSQTINRQLRMLAESRLTNKQTTMSAEESSSQMMQDPLELDTDLAVDLAALPPEFIENLQNIFQMELVDNPDVPQVNDNMNPLPFSDKEEELQNGDVGDVFNSAILGEIVEPSLLMMDPKIAEGVTESDQANLDDLSSEKLADMNLEGNLEYVERKIEFLQNEIKNYERADPAIKDRIKIENEEINVKEEIFMPEFIDDQCGTTEHDDSDLLKEAQNSLFLGDGEEACDGSENLNEKDHNSKDLHVNASPQLRKDNISDALGRSDSELIASDFLGESSIVTDAPSGETIDMCVEKSFPEISGNEQMQDLTPTFNVDSNLENDDQFAAYDLDNEIVPDDQDTGYVVENGVVLGEQAGVYDVDNIENFADDQVSAFNVDDSMPSLGATDMYNVEGDQLAEYTMEDSSLAQDATLCTGDNSTQFDVEANHLDQPSCVLQNVQKQSVMFTKTSTPSYNTHHTPTYDMETREEPNVFAVSTSSSVPPQIAVSIASCDSPAVQKENRPDTPKKDVVCEEEQNVDLMDTSREEKRIPVVPDNDNITKDEATGDKTTVEASSGIEDRNEEMERQNALPLAVPLAVPPLPEPAPMHRSVSFDACTQTEPPEEEEETTPTVSTLLNLLKQHWLQPDSSNSPCGGSSTPSFLDNSEVLLQNIQAALQSHGSSQNQPRPYVSAPRTRKSGFADRKGKRSYVEARKSLTQRGGNTFQENQSRPVLQRSFSYNSDSNSDAVMPVLVEEIPSSEISSQWLRDRTIVPEEDQVESERELEEVGVKASEEHGECSGNVDVSDTMREMLRVDKEMQRLLAYKMKLYKKMYQRGGVLNTRSKRISCDTEMQDPIFSSVRDDFSLFDKSLQQLNEVNASGSGGSNVGVISACSVGGGDGVCGDSRQGSGSKNHSRLEMDIETASNVCPSPQTTSLTPAREAFGGSPAPSVPCTVPTPSSPLSHCFRTCSEAEVGSRAIHFEPSRTPAMCDSDSHLSSHIRASSTSAQLSHSLNSVSPTSNVGAHQSPVGPVSKSPDCSDSVTQKSHTLQHNGVLSVQSPPMVRFPSDYCLSVCSTSNLHDVVNSQASIESLLNISECHPVNDQAGDSVSVCHTQLQPDRNTFDTCIVEDVINSALSEQCDTNNSTNVIDSPQKQNTSHLMEVELTRTHSNKIDDQLKLTDTSVVEAVLNTFALPECTERRPENDLMSSPISESKAEPDSTDGGCEQGEPMIPSTTNSESEGGATPPSVINNRSYARRSRRRAMSRFSNRLDIARDHNDKESVLETLPLKVGEERFLGSHQRARRGRGRGRRARGEGFAIRGSPSGHSPREANLTPKHTFDGESLENSDQQRSLHQPDSTRDTPVETPEVPETPTTPTRRRRKNAGQITSVKEEPSPVRKEEPKPKGRKKIVEPAVISGDTVSDFRQESIEKVETEEKIVAPVLSVEIPLRRQTRRRTKKVYPDNASASESDPFVTYPTRRPKKRKIEVVEETEPPVLVEVAEKVEKIEKSGKADVVDKEKVPKVEEKNEVEKVEKVSKTEKVLKPERVAKSEKSSKVEKVEKVSKPEKAEKLPKIEKVEKASKPEKMEKPSKPEKVERASKSEKVEKTLKSEKTEKVSKSEKTEKVSKVEKVEKVSRAEKAEKVSKAEKVEKLSKAEKAEKASKPEKIEKVVKPEKTARSEKKERERTPRVEKPRKGTREVEKREKVKESKEEAPAARERSQEPLPGDIDGPESTVSPGDEPLANRLLLHRSFEQERVPTPVPASRASSAASTPAMEGNIKDCYIVIKPLDVTQYLNKSAGGGKALESEEESSDEDDDDDDDGEEEELEEEEENEVQEKEKEEEEQEQEEREEQEVEDERDDAVERVLERIRQENNSAGSTPSDPTQEIESQLALLEELSSHLEETRSLEEATAAPAADAPPPAIPIVDSPLAGGSLSIHDDTSVSTFVSDCVSAPSDADVPAKRARLDAAAAPALAPAPSSTLAATPSSSASPEDYDKDSVSSGDPDSPSKAQKHKSRKRKRRADATEHISFEAHRGSVLDVKTVGRHVLAACEDGNVYCYSLKSGKLKRQYSGHEEAVVCITILEREGPEGEDPVPEFLFTGSLDHKLRCFQFKTGTLVNQPVNLGKPIQCMDEMWGILFMGTKMGDVAKFYTKSFKLNEEFLKCSKDTILAVKATKEGARKVVIVAARSEPVAVRDAHSGLLMRVIGQNLPIHTVYSLRLDSSLLYCGTNTGKIPVFQFTTGDEVTKYSAGYGVVCMSIYNHLLFAGCYDGNIYVYNTQDKSFITCIPGPGKMLLCLDVAKNRIIAGSKDNKLEAWPLPPDVKNCIRESKHR